MEKKPFVTLEQLREMKKTYPTPFHLYDEKGIRKNAKKLQEAFSWNPGFREYFAVKATPNPFIINILKELGCGVDCSSETELMMTRRRRNSGSRTGWVPLSTWMILRILNFWRKPLAVFRKRLAAVIIRAGCLRSAMTSWTTRAIPSTA